MNEETYQCDACAAIVPRSQVKSGIPSAGVEGTFCAECRGVDPDPDYISDDEYWNPLIENRDNPNHVVVNGESTTSSARRNQTHPGSGVAPEATATRSDFTMADR